MKKLFALLICLMFAVPVFANGDSEPAYVNTLDPVVIITEEPVTEPVVVEEPGIIIAGGEFDNATVVVEEEPAAIPVDGFFSRFQIRGGAIYSLKSLDLESLETNTDDGRKWVAAATWPWIDVKGSNGKPWLTSDLGFADNGIAFVDVTFEITALSNWVKWDWARYARLGVGAYGGKYLSTIDGVNLLGDWEYGISLYFVDLNLDSYNK